jgi:hypothetical protein
MQEVPLIVLQKSPFEIFVLVLVHAQQDVNIDHLSIVIVSFAHFQFYKGTSFVDMPAICFGRRQEGEDFRADIVLDCACDISVAFFWLKPLGAMLWQHVVAVQKVLLFIDVKVKIFHLVKSSVIHALSESVFWSNRFSRANETLISLQKAYHLRICPCS